MEVPVPGDRTRARVLLWMAPLPILGFLLFGSTGRDDAYITYWVADQLRRTGRITNYNDRRLEQSSSLLHVLVLSAVSWVTRVPVATVAPWFAIIAGALCAPVAYRLAGRLDPRGCWVAAALVATLPPLVYWSFGGLETSLTTLLVLSASFATISLVEAPSPSRSRIGVAATVVAVVAVRPEMGLVFTVALSIAALVVRLAVADSWSGYDGRGRSAAARQILVVALATAATAILIAVARKAYFGDWVPRPVLMKTGAPHIGLGIHYTMTTLVQSGAVVSLVVAAVVAATRWRALTPGWIIVACLVAVGTAAVIEPGGDWMEAGRLLVPWLAIAVVMVGAILGRVSGLRAILAVVLVAVSGAGLVNYAARYSTGEAAWSHLVWHDTGSIPANTACTTSSGNWFERRNVKHARDARFVCEADPVFAALAKVVAPARVVYASGQAGMVVSYLQQHARRRGDTFSFIDWFGLTDDTWDVCRKGVSARPQGKPVSMAKVLNGRCGALPDVMTGIGDAFIRVLTPKYTLIFVQRGKLTSSSWPRGTRPTGTEWLMVRRDLAAKLRAEMRREEPGIGTAPG